MYLGLAKRQRFPVADWLATQGFNLPSSATLTEHDVGFVCDELCRILEESEG